MNNGIAFVINNDNINNINWVELQSKVQDQLDAMAVDDFAAEAAAFAAHYNDRNRRSSRWIEKKDGSQPTKDAKFTDKNRNAATLKKRHFDKAERDGEVWYVARWDKLPNGNYITKEKFVHDSKLWKPMNSKANDSFTTETDEPVVSDDPIDSSAIDPLYEEWLNWKRTEELLELREEVKELRSENASLVKLANKMRSEIISYLVEMNMIDDFNMWLAR